jgi:hypothetical protein
MTREEFFALRAGDKVEISLPAFTSMGLGVGKWYPGKVAYTAFHCEVSSRGPVETFSFVDVRLTKNGTVIPRKPARTVRWWHEAQHGDLACIRRPDPSLTFEGNVFADWLDERGFPMAARALREAFPISDYQEGLNR